MLCEGGRHVDPRRALDALPAGNAVDLEHVVASVGPAQEVDARIVGAERSRRPHAQALAGGVKAHWARVRPARKVGAPARADPLDRGHHALADDERAYLTARMR